MKSSENQGVRLAKRHAGRFRVVGYDELRTKATLLAGQLLADYRGQKIVVVPILMGGGLPARLVIDTLLSYGIISEVVPCRIRRYTGIDEAGAAEFTVDLPVSRVRGRIVVGIDDLVDGGETLAAFRTHALERGAASVEEAVIFAKPHSRVVPKYCVERGVDEWLVMPGEEHDFMSTLMQADEDVRGLATSELADYFTGIGLSAESVADWQNLRPQLRVTNG